MVNNRCINTEHFIVNYSPLCLSEGEIVREIKTIEEAYRKIPLFLNIRKKTLPRIIIDLLETNDPWRTCLDIRNNRVEFGGAKVGLAPYFHELIHFFTYPFPPSHLLRNGIAEYGQMKLGEFYKDMHLDQIIRDGCYISLEKLSPAFSDFSADQRNINKNRLTWQISYYEAGCFVQYLVEQCGGMKKFMNFYESAVTEPLDRFYMKFYKRTLAQLEKDWLKIILGKKNSEQARFVTMGYQEFDKEFYRNLHLRYLIAAGFVSKKDIVIDAACGCGYGSSILSERAKEVIAFDNDAEAILFAKKYHSLPNIKYRNFDIERINIPQCDIFVSISTIEHLENIEKFIGRIKKATRKYIIISLTVIPRKHIDSYHKRDFTPDDIINLVEDKNWKLFSDLRQKEENMLGRQIAIFYNRTNI